MEAKELEDESENATGQSKCLKDKTLSSELSELLKINIH
jgi:hypothetical protein